MVLTTVMMMLSFQLEYHHPFDQMSFEIAMHHFCKANTLLFYHGLDQTVTVKHQIDHTLLIQYC